MQTTKQWTKGFSLLCTISLLLLSCSSVPTQKMPEGQPKDNAAKQAKMAAQKAIVDKFLSYETELPGASPELAQTYKAYGNPQSKKVIVFAQGGPAEALHPKGIALLLHDAGLDMQQNLLVQVKQTSMLLGVEGLNKEIFVDFEEAKKIGKQDIELLRNVVKFLQGQEKLVSLIGMSYGTWVLAGYLAEYGNDVYRLALAVGRLDLPDEAWQAFVNGVYFRFAEDGQTLLIQALPPLPPHLKTVYANLLRIAPGLGHRRFTKELADMDCSNLLFIYALNDVNVGRLSEAELTFLQKQEAKVVSSAEGHGGADNDYAKPLLAFLLGQTDRVQQK